MFDSVDILNELTEISPTVAKIGSDNLYKVPDGYFESFASKMMQILGADPVKSENEGLSPLLLKVGKQNMFELPAGYFENFADSFMNKIKEAPFLLTSTEKQNTFSIPSGYFEGFAEKLMDRIKAEGADASIEELKTIAPSLDSIGNQSPLTAPEGYFENFADKIVARIKAEEAGSPMEELQNLSPLLSGLNKQTPFTLPEGYFAGLSENVVTGAKAVDFVNTELENLSPIMSGLKDKQLYEVPTGYFDGVAASVLQKIKNQPEQARVISIKTKTNWLRYAAAAVVIGVVISSAMFVINKNRAEKPGFAKLDEKQLADSLHNTNDEDILNYLQTHNVPIIDSSNNNVASLELNDAAADDMLAEVSDNELQQYVDEHDGTKDLATN